MKEQNGKLENARSSATECQGKSTDVTAVTAASKSEQAGFQALLTGDLAQARKDFGQAYNAFPYYHNVDEIYHKVLTPKIVDEYQKANPSRKKELLLSIYKMIVDRYSWGAPPEVIIQMRR